MSGFIKVNDIEINWRSGLTIKSLLDEVKDNREIIKFRGHGLIVMVNHNILSVFDKYEYVINSGDDIKLIQMVGGG